MQPQDMERRIRHGLTQMLGPGIANRCTLQNLGGHASLRIYWRIHLPAETRQNYPRNGELTLMAMVMPLSEDARKSEEGNAANAPVPAELPFVNVHRWLSKIGMPVPEIDYLNLENGILFLEDLGDEMFENAVLAAKNTEEVENLYREAIDLLIDFQKATLADAQNSDQRVENLYREAIDLLIDFQKATLADAQNSDQPDECLVWQRAFDYDLLFWELEHYLEWGLEERLGKESIAPHRPNLETAFRSITERLLELPQTIVLRDYQSRNIMRKNNAWILIDFQDALRGPYIYDLVALLRDSYIELAPETVTRLVAYYAERGKRAGLPWCTSFQDVENAFHLQTLQRKLKDAGRFIFIDRVKNNSSFLPYYEPSIGFVQNALAHLPDFENLLTLLLEIEPAMQLAQRKL